MIKYCLKPINRLFQTFNPFSYRIFNVAPLLLGPCIYFEPELSELKIFVTKIKEPNKMKVAVMLPTS